MKAVPDQARMFRDFLFYFLKNSIIVHCVISHSKRSAGLIGVSRETLDNIYERKLAALDDRKESLLHQAFHGNL